MKYLESGPHQIFNFVRLTATILFVGLGAASVTLGQELPMQQVDDLMARTFFKFDHKVIRYTRGITQGRYMEDDIQGGCVAATFPKWEEFHLIQCKYKQSDVVTQSHFKVARVIMLNPEKLVLAKWIVASCRIVTGTVERQCIDQLAAAIIDAAGSQFVIAGIVLEDQRPANPDGIQEAYTFRNGVTVKLKNGLPVGHTGSYSVADNDLALNPDAVVESTASTAGPARIQSTKRTHYLAYMGSQAKDVTGLKWLEVVRDSYQDAWRRAHNGSLSETVEKYRNDLMVARCFALTGINPPPH